MLLQVPIYVRALDLRHAAELKDAGASNVITATVETGLVLGSSLLQVSLALTQAWKLWLWLQPESALLLEYWAHITVTTCCRVWAQRAATCST